ncbi:hypothetical protein IJF86_02600 [Candidatus Saccharibacteria bacterium]|nr:hypothetical protein [Candidatus Saccharibacteria bacterium]
MNGYDCERNPYSEEYREYWRRRYFHDLFRLLADLKNIRNLKDDYILAKHVMSRYDLWMERCSIAQSIRRCKAAYADFCTASLHFNIAPPLGDDDWIEEMLANPHFISFCLDHIDGEMTLPEMEEAWANSPTSV